MPKLHGWVVFGEHPDSVEGSESLVGRDAEIARISSFLDDVATGPTALLISGEHGIGKTALWMQAVSAAGDRSVRVLVARPAEADTHLAFGGLDDLLRDVLPQILSGLPAPQQRALSVALLLEDPEGPPPELRTVAVASREALRTLAEDHPVLIAVDDLQWLDKPTAMVLSRVLRRIDPHPVGFVTTVRGREPMASDLARALPRERVASMPLGPLSLGAIHRLVVERLGRGLSRPALMRVHETSGGNPFFALEIARALLAAGGHVRPGQPFPVPEDLRALLRMRLGALSRETRDVLAVVALLADRSVATIRRIFGDDVRAAVESAIDADVVEIEGERLRFTHPLLASAVTAGLLPDTLRSLHRRIAEVVEDPEERARHLALATDGPDETVAAALDRAAERAATRGAPSVAGEIEELAGRLTPANEVHARRRRTLKAARHLMLSGEMERAAVLGRALLEEDLTSDERVDALLLVADLQEDFEGSTAMAEQAATDARDDPERSFAALTALAGFKLNLGDVRAALVDARRAMAMAERLGDLTHIVPAIGFVALAELWANDVTPGLLERGVELEISSSGVGAQFPGLAIYFSPAFVVGWTSMVHDLLDDARRRFEEAHARALVAGDEISRLGILLHLTELECRAGRWEVAAALAVEGFEGEEQLGGEYQPASALYPRALVAAHLGQADEARALAEQGLATAASMADEIFRFQNASVLGFLELSLGNAPAADAILRPLADRLEDLGWKEPSVYRVPPNAIEALVVLGELDEARRLLTRLEVNGRAANSVWAEACAGRCRGLLLAAEGDLPGAIDALETALATHDRFPGPFERARTLLTLGICQRRGKQKAAARRSIRGALDGFEELGARLWSERARAELDRIGGRAPSPLELTPTERRVAALVAEGMSNREIADRLFVSVRTVEGHLSSVYRKLGVRSRTELTRRLAPAGGV